MHLAVAFPQHDSHTPALSIRDMAHCPLALYTCLVHECKLPEGVEYYLPRYFSIGGYADCHCNQPRASPALVSNATGQYDKNFILSLTHSCMISFGAASCSLMTSSYHCYCLVSPIPFCIGVICSPARSVLDLSLDTYLYHRSQLPCVETVLVV